MDGFCGLIDRRGEPASPDGLTSMMTAMEVKLDGAHIYNRDNLLIGGQARIATLPACEGRKTPIAFFSARFTQNWDSPRTAESTLRD